MIESIFFFILQKITFVDNVSTIFEWGFLCQMNLSTCRQKNFLCLEVSHQKNRFPPRLLCLLWLYSLWGNYLYHDINIKLGSEIIFQFNNSNYYYYYVTWLNFIKLKIRFIFFSSYFLQFSINQYFKTKILI